MANYNRMLEDIWNKQQKQIAGAKKRMRQAENDRANAEGKAARAAETAAIDAEMQEQRAKSGGYKPFTTGGVLPPGEGTPDISVEPVLPPGEVPSFEDWKKNKTNEEREAGPTGYEEWKAQQPEQRTIMTSGIDLLGKRTSNTLSDVGKWGHRGGGVSNRPGPRDITDENILANQDDPGRPLSEAGRVGPTGLYQKRVNYPGQGVEVSPHPTGLGGGGMSYGGPKYQEYLGKEGRPPTRGEGLSAEDEKWPLENVLETIDEAEEAGLLSSGHAIGMKKEVLSGRPGARASVVERLQELVRLEDVRRHIN